MSLSLFGRRPADPADTEARTRAEIDRARALAGLRREQEHADRAAHAEAERLARQARRDRDAERAERRQRRAAARRRVLARVRLLVPLLIVNAAAVYGQIAYAYAAIAPAEWRMPARVALSVLFAAAVESIAVYVGWHAHDALLSKATATAARLRRASYAIAATVAGINYAHFAGTGMAPTAAAVAFGLLSLLSPWLWGLHTRRIQHVQLVDEGAVDGSGATFSAERVRAFPIRAWAARRWSIDHNVTDPAAAWAGYNTERAARRNVRTNTFPAGRLAAAWVALTGILPTNPPAIDPPAAEAPAGQPAATGDGAPTRPATRTPRKTVKPATTAAAVARLRAKHPDMSAADIAKRLKVTDRTVRRYLSPPPPDQPGTGLAAA
jgi:hypothetical protein